MNAPDDAELLAEYATSRTEAAFALLVTRHIDHIYSAALRQVGNPEMAHDVVQTVFLVLERKAGHLRPGIVLGAWLQTTTRLAALLVEPESVAAHYFPPSEDSVTALPGLPSLTEPGLAESGLPALERLASGPLAGNAENDQTPIPDWMRTAQFRRGPDLAAASRRASNTAAHYRSLGDEVLVVSCTGGERGDVQNQGLPAL